MFADCGGSPCPRIVPLPDCEDVRHGQTFPFLIVSPANHGACFRQLRSSPCPFHTASPGPGFAVRSAGRSKSGYSFHRCVFQVCAPASLAPLPRPGPPAVAGFGPPRSLAVLTIWSFAYSQTISIVDVIFGQRQAQVCHKQCHMDTRIPKNPVYVKLRQKSNVAQSWRTASENATITAPACRASVLEIPSQVHPNLEIEPFSGDRPPGCGRGAETRSPVDRRISRTCGFCASLARIASRMRR